MPDFIRDYRDLRSGSRVGIRYGRRAAIAGALRLRSARRFF